MSSMVSRWPVVVSVPLEPGDVDGDRLLTDAAVERIGSLGRSAYFDLCTTVPRDGVLVLGTSIHNRSAPVTREVTISVSVVELFPDRFTMHARIRPAESDGVAADVMCSVSAGEVTKAMRDEFIALAHTAQHFH